MAIPKPPFTEQMMRDLVREYFPHPFVILKDLAGRCPISDRMPPPYAPSPEIDRSPNLTRLRLKPGTRLDLEK